MPAPCRSLINACPASRSDADQLVPRAADIDWRALEGSRAIGITAGASAPEILIREVIDAFAARYDLHEKVIETATENVEFKVPRILREADSA